MAYPEIIDAVYLVNLNPLVRSAYKFTIFNFKLFNYVYESSILVMTL